MKVFVVYNPAAGGKKAAHQKVILQEALDKNKVTADWYETKYPGDAIEMLKNKDLTNYNALLCLGGDGTLFEVVNGYMANTSVAKPPVGIIPAGTGNSFALEFGLTIHHSPEALKIVLDGHVGYVDLGYCELKNDSYYFANIWGLGFVTDVLEIAVKWKWTGKMAYNIGVLYNLINLRHSTLKITSNKQSFSQENLLVEVSNTKYTGGNYLMAPTAHLADGLLDVTVAEKMGRMKLLQLFAKIFKGTHIHDQKIKHFKTNEIYIEGEGKMLSPDGELRGTLPARVRCIKAALPVYLPQNFAGGKA